MSHKKKGIITLLIMALSLAILPANGKAEESSSKKTYFVSIVPQAYMLERIVGEDIDVAVMVPPGKNPATYEPTPRQMMELGEAEAFFTIGVPFEKAFIPTVESSLPNLPLVDAAKGIERRTLEAHDHHEEGEDHANEKHDEADHEENGEADNDEEHDHEAGTPDPHVWLSPILAKTLSENMAAYLIQSDPEGKETYEANLASLLSDLDDLDNELAGVLAPLKGETLFVYHPAFGYFADRYGMHQEAIETGGKEPSAADLERIIDEAKEDGVKVILVQPEFSQSSAKAVAQAIGGAVISVAPLEKDYINNLRNLATQLKESL